MSIEQKIERYPVSAGRRQPWTDEEIATAEAFAPPSAAKAALYERKRAERAAAQQEPHQ